MLSVTPLDIPDVKLVVPRKFGDERGFFSETYNARRFAEAGIADAFVQDNHSYSSAKGTVRGLHFQAPPHAQAKLVRVLRGAIYDVAVDLRRSSPTHGRWVAAELSAANFSCLYIPEGFAHGFCTLTPDTEVLYKVTDFYAPETDRGVRWDDPALAIPWPLAGVEAKLSDKDGRHPALADLDAYFE